MTLTNTDCGNSTKFCPSVPLPCKDGDKFAVQEFASFYAVCKAGKLDCEMCPPGKPNFNFFEKQCDAEQKFWAADCEKIFPTKEYNTSTMCDVEQPCTLRKKYADRIVCQGYHECIGIDQYEKHSCPNSSDKFDYIERKCLPGNIGKCCSELYEETLVIFHYIDLVLLLFHLNRTSTMVISTTNKFEKLTNGVTESNMKTNISNPEIVKKNSSKDLIIILASVFGAVFIAIFLTVTILVCRK